MKVTDFAIRHPVVITISLVALALFGFIGAGQMSQELFAQVDMPKMMILTTYPGAGPEDVEREVSSIIENHVSTLSGISSITSSSYDSFSIVEVGFDWNMDLDKKIGDMREKITDATKELPPGIDGAPRILRYSSSILPIYSFAVESSMPDSELNTYINDTILPRLARVPGVAQTTLRGTADEEVLVTVRTADLAAYRINLLDVFKLLQANNITLPAGQVSWQEQILNLRVRGQYNSLASIENLVIGIKDNAFIHLSDIATVTIDKQKVQEYATRENVQIIVTEIIKQQGADTVKVVRSIKKILDDITAETGHTVSFITINDDSYNVRLSVNSVRDSAIQGAFLAIFVIFLFLHNIRSTFIIGISIPFSILLSFCFMTIKGQGINLMTLGGLTVAVGMIVDNSIVVLENIHRQYLLLGDAKKAASIGTSEVGGSIIASTATTLVVFIPILFLQGFAGIILSDVALTIVWAIGSSMIVALVVVPFLSAYLLRPVMLKPDTLRSRLSGIWDRGYELFEKFYVRFLEKSLSNRKFVLSLAIVLLGLSGMSATFLGFEFLSETDMNEIDLKITFPNTYTLENTRDRMKEIDLFTRALVPEIETTAFYSGTDSSLGMFYQNNAGFARIRLVPSSQRNRTVFEIIRQLRIAIPSEFGDMELIAENGGLGQLMNMATGGGGFMLDVYGPDLNDLYKSASAISAIIKQDSAVDEVNINTNFDKREMILLLDQESMGMLGLTSYDTALLSRILFNGAEAGLYRSGTISRPITVKSDLAQSSITESVFNSIYLTSLSGSSVPYSVAADITIENTVNQVSKKDKMKTISIQALLNNPDLRSLQKRILPAIEQLNLPSGVQWGIAGSAASMAETFRSLFLMMAIAVFLVYMVMVIQFERFTQPLIVMVSIPFAFIGIVISLALFGTMLSIVSILGVITLVGTVVNTAIVLIDYTNLLRREPYNLPLKEAVITGGKSRLRPILMSVLTTVIGLIPLAFSLGEGAEVYAPLGQAILGGLVTSTFITLILIPVLYYMSEKRKEEKKLEKNITTNSILM